MSDDSKKNLRTESINKKFQRKIVMIFAFLMSVTQLDSKAQFLSVSGQKIVNDSGQEVVLNAMNLGNWMVMEGYMMNSGSQAPDQHTWKAKLTTLMGPVNTKTFYDSWLNNFVTKDDIYQIKAWGFNSIRVPLHYEYFVNLGLPDVWNPQGFALLDNVVNWCKEANMYVVIDLHATPGGQSNNAISDYDNTKPSLWESAENRSKTVRLWDKLSERYINEAWVAGYDLINEPAWDLPGNTLLREIYNQITTAVRANGDNHILFIEGNSYSNDHTGLTPAWDNNLVYVFHKYWSAATTEDIKWITDFRTAQNKPIWCGEHGENSNEHFTKIVETFKANNIGFSWWSYKKFESFNGFASPVYPSGYMDLLNYLGGTNPSYSPTTAFNTCMQMAENQKLVNCIPQTEVLRAIFTQPGNRSTAPFTSQTIPGRIYATQYDFGMNGYAYSDETFEDVRFTTGSYSGWNSGWVYRNNGVDIEKSSEKLSNGYAVGWFSPFEWMNYTVNVANAGTYTLEIRASNGGSSNGQIQIQDGSGAQILATATIPTTGGWGTYQTFTVSGGFSSAGTQTIRIANTGAIGSSFNIASVNFVFVNSTVPTTTPTPTIEKKISLKGSNGSYLTFNSSTGVASTTKLSVGSTEEWSIVDAGNGYSAIKASNGKYLSLSGTDVKATATSIGPNEKFIATNVSGNVYYFKGPNNLYVSSENGATSGLTCTRTAPGGWEFFNWSIVSTTIIPKVAVTGVSLSPTSVTLGVTQTQQITATVTPANATNKNISFSSSNPSVATVNSVGLVTAMAVGNATITVTTQDGNKTATFAVTVSDSIVPVSSVILSPTSATIAKGATRQLIATVSPSDATNKNVTFTSSNPSVATVNSSGLITAVSGGNAIITVVTVEGNKTATAAITVPSGAPIPGKIEAESYSSMSGVQTESTSDVGGGLNVGWIEANDWMEYDVYVTSSGTYTVEFIVSTNESNVRLQLLSSSTLLGTLTVPTATGGWQNWATMTMQVTLNAGTQKLRINALTSGVNLN